jgi:hypothetical protein
MKMTDPNDKMLDDLFAEARGVASEPSDALTARVLADAAEARAPSPISVPQPNLWSRFMDAIGGWPAVSGLAAATVAGIWIGVAPPTSVQDVTSTLIGDEVSVSLFSTDFGLDEGMFVDG